MEEEIEDIVGEVKLSDSQKSVATSNLYSLDLTDCSSDKNNSSGKETYVLDKDDSDDSEETFIPNTKNTFKLNDRSGTIVQVNHLNEKPVNDAKTTIRIQEIYTQTSKTIIELAEYDEKIKGNAGKSTLQTQTSLKSISESKTVEYMLEICSPNSQFNKKGVIGGKNPSAYIDISYNTVLNNSLEDISSVLESIPENERKVDDKSHSSSDEFIPLIDDELDVSNKQIILEHKMDLNDSSVYDSEFEEDSLMRDCSKNTTSDDNKSENSDTPKSVDGDVEELYSKLATCFDFVPEKRDERELRPFGALTPLTEESAVKKESLIDISPMIEIPSDINEEIYKDFFLSDNSKIKPKDRSGCNNEFKAKELIKLPPIESYSHPSTPKSTFVLSKNGSTKLSQKAGTLSSLFECHRSPGKDRWEMDFKNFASGEGNTVNSMCYESKRTPHEPLLPPILHEHKYSSKTGSYPMSASSNREGTESPHDSLCIMKRIMELKNSTKSRSAESKSSTHQPQSRSCSPRSTISHYGNAVQDVAEKSCEALCVELLKRLHSSAWVDVSETLEGLPKQLEKFWGVISEGRIADLIRQILVHVESPRTQLAKTACVAIACILKNTNYTKKPDFYEAMTILLIKTGSYSRPLRRAANIALDDVVSGVDLTQAVTALCIHGVSHKNPLVRCSAARLLVVGAALGAGGRELLRARPASAATARRHAFRALATLLDDKSTPARKYAERFYQMLRPLPNFEAYFLSDVDLETASRHMKKYDHLLKTEDAKETR